MEQEIHRAEARDAVDHLGHLPAEEPERLVFMEQAPPPFYAAPVFRANTYIYSKHEESGMGLKLALQLSRLLVEDRSLPT